jgi:predicted nucleotide-binding protein with TIR-like domain
MTVPIIPARKNIFLDFLSPENHVIYGTDSNLSEPARVQLLCESLNVAVLLSGDYCLLPPFFALQSNSVKEVLLLKSDFLKTGAIWIPIREAALTNFFEKKITEYEGVRHLYPGLFERQGQLFVERFAASIIKRTASVGKNIANRWEAGPDERRVWRPLIDELTPTEIEALRSVPNILKEGGKSVTWPAMQPHLPPEIERAEFAVNQALQHEYTLIYLEEYNATIITGAPPKTTDLLIAAPDLSYDYQSFRGVLLALGLWDSIRVMDASSILQLKLGGGFLDFISLFDYVCKRATARQQVVHHFARLYYRLGHLKARYMREISYVSGLALSGQRFKAVEIINEFLFELTSLEHSQGGLVLVQSPAEHHHRLSPQRRPLMNKVFVVHGRDHGVRDQILLFLQGLGLQPIVMENEPMAGRTLVEKFEGLAQQCEYAIIIATPDDDLTYSGGNPVKRIRQNVILEIGYFWGRNGRHNKFSILLKPDTALDIPTDISGIGYIPITDDLGQTKLKLQEELRQAGVL